jgi:hypothetical protein
MTMLSGAPLSSSCNGSSAANWSGCSSQPRSDQRRITILGACGLPPALSLLI